MNGLRKYWIEVTAVCAALYAVLYAIAWFRRASCGALEPFPCAVSAAMRFGADIVLLGWIDSTLGAGMLAVLGGAFVLTAVTQQRRHALEDRAKAEAEALAHALWELRQAWYWASLKLHRTGKIGTIETALQQVVAAATVLPLSALELITKTTALARIASTIIEANEEDADQQLERIFFVARNFFADPDRLIENGRYVHRPAILDEEQMKEASSLGLLNDDRPIWVDDLLSPGED